MEAGTQQQDEGEPVGRGEEVVERGCIGGKAVVCTDSGCGVGCAGRQCGWVRVVNAVDTVKHE